MLVIYAALEEKGLSWLVDVSEHHDLRRRGHEPVLFRAYLPEFGTQALNGGRAFGQMGRNAFWCRREISRSAMQELDLQRGQCRVEQADLVHGAFGKHLGTEAPSEGEPVEGGIETGGADAVRGKYRTEKVVLADLQGQRLAVQVQADAPCAAGTIVGHRDVRPRAAWHGFAGVDADHVVGATGE